MILIFREILRNILFVTNVTRHAIYDKLFCTVKYARKRRLEGKTVLVTGGNCGIGLETSKDLAIRGAEVVILCRDATKGKEAVQIIKDSVSDAVVDLIPLDLADFSSIRKCAATVHKKYPKIDILINNAGVGGVTKQKTKDGYEMHFGVNHLGHFLFTLLLLENIKAASPSRIVNVSSCVHEKGWMNWTDLNNSGDYVSVDAYAHSKLANILFTKSLEKKLKGKGVTTYAVHPGVAKTSVFRHVRSVQGIIGDLWLWGLKIFMKTPKEGAQTIIYCATEQKLADESGFYYSNNERVVPSKLARNEKDAERLWDLSMQMVELSNYKL